MVNERLVDLKGIDSYAYFFFFPVVTEILIVASLAAAIVTALPPAEADRGAALRA